MRRGQCWLLLGAVDRRSQANDHSTFQPAVARQRATVLPRHATSCAVRRDQLDATRRKILREFVGVVCLCLVPDEPLWLLWEEAGVERGVDEGDFMRCSAGHVDGAVGDASPLLKE
jgi:hypothetical protein